MIREAQADKTLLVDGPASVRLVSGKAEILGASVDVGERIVIRDGKRIPFYIKKDASFDIEHGAGLIVEADGDTIPVSWKKAAEDTLSLGKPTVAMIVGGVDSGKTSLCTFLANRALTAKRTVAVIDGDLGQSDIGPPTTIGLTYISKPVKDLFDVEASEVCFVGFISPSGAEERIANCLVGFKKRILDKDVDFLVMNTDGWVEGERAVQYKVMITETVAPNIVVCMEQEEKLASILSQLRRIRVLTVEPSSVVRKRDREKRKVLRELSYRRHFRNSKVETFPLNRVRIEATHFSPRLCPRGDRLREIEEILGVQPVFCQETVKALWLFLKGDQRLDLGRPAEAEEVFQKKVKMMKKGDELGLIAGLHDNENRFLGLGIIRVIDYHRKVVRVFTSTSQGVATVRVGNVRLDDACREISTTGILGN